jgi:hypothetical protein
MPNREHATSKRSPLRRRLETATEFGALMFFIVLGSAVYQNVSRGMPRSSGPSTSGPIETQPNSVGSSKTIPREGPSPVGSPIEPKSAAALPGEAKRSETPSVTGSIKPEPPSDRIPTEQAPSTIASNEAAPGSASASGVKQGEEGSNVAAAAKPEQKASLLSPASLNCATGSPTSWQFANVQLIDSASGRASSLVTSCRISSDIAAPVGCQNPVIVGVGVASSKGINATEIARALRRGINLASALRKNLQAGCPGNVTVSAYVLNLGRYSDEQQRDQPDQRKVIALVATGAEDGEKAAVDAVAS